MEATDEDVLRGFQARQSLHLILEKQRLVACEGPVREQFETELRALTDAEQDSKELRSAKRALLFDRIIESVELPFPVGPATVEGEPPAVKDSLTKQFVKKAADAIYKDLVRKKIAVDKRRPDGRGTEEIRPIDCEVRVSPRTHGSALFTRGQTQIMSLLTLGTAKEGQRIDDLSLETDRRFHRAFPAQKPRTLAGATLRRNSGARIRLRSPGSAASRLLSRIQSVMSLRSSMRAASR